MKHKTKREKIGGKFFTWRLLRRDGVYYADGRGGRHDLGKHSLGSRNKELALQNLQELDAIKAIELGLTEAVSESNDEAISIADGWQRYEDYSARAQIMGGASSNTIKRYRAVRVKHKQFCNAHGIHRWADFNRSALEKYGSFLAKTKADRTIYLELTLLKSVISWLIGEDLLPATCHLKYPMRKPKGTDTYCYTPAEVSAMIKHCRADPALQWLANVITALAHSGLRISELASLRWSDLNLAQDLQTVADERSSKRKRDAGIARTTKGGKSRTIPIHRQLKLLFSGMHRTSDGYVFHAHRGGRLRPRNVLKMFIENVIEPLKSQFPAVEGDIGFEHGRLHSFRHFFCSQAFLGGASEGEIREWLGHADSRMVEHYRHLRREDAQRKMNQIDFIEAD